MSHGQSGASDSQPVVNLHKIVSMSKPYVSILKEFATDYSNASFEQCRVALVVRRVVIIISNYVLTECNKCLVYYGFYYLFFVSLRRDTASQYGKGRNISITRLRYSANHNALDSWPIRAHLASQNDELCKNRLVSERRSIEGQQ